MDTTLNLAHIAHLLFYIHIEMGMILILNINNDIRDHFYLGDLDLENHSRVQDYFNSKFEIYFCNHVETPNILLLFNVLFLYLYYILFLLLCVLFNNFCPSSIFFWKMFQIILRKKND